MIMSFGGIPLIYYGDEIGTLNDYSYLEYDSRKHDNRWMHRPRINWDNVELRNKRGTVQQRIFDGLNNMIAVRKTIYAFADFNNRELIEVSNEHLFVFIRINRRFQESVLVVANFDSKPQHLNLADLGRQWKFEISDLRDLVTGETPAKFNDQLVIPPLHFYWLSDRQ